MSYSFDHYGWLSESPIHGRETEIAPPLCAAGYQPNFTGIDWVCAFYVEPTPIVPPAPTEKCITGLEYLRRFTQAQRIAIRTLANTDPIAQDLMHLLDSTISQGGQVNLLDTDTIAGVNYLAAMLPAQNIIPSTILE